MIMLIKTVHVNPRDLLTYRLFSQCCWGSRYTPQALRMV